MELNNITIPQWLDKIIYDDFEAIYEPRFLNCMYGFRPNRGCHDAIKEVHTQLSNGHINHVVDADIKGFFDHLSHEWMMEFLKFYIKDPNLLWLINKYLKSWQKEQWSK